MDINREFAYKRNIASELKIWLHFILIIIDGRNEYTIKKLIFYDDICGRCPSILKDIESGGP